MPTFRPAAAGDAIALRDLERDTNLVALAHVFRAEEHPFPEAAVLSRWRAELEEAGLWIDVLDRPGGLACYVAHDEHVIRHLAVHPEAWGRGLGRAAVELAASRMLRPTLWCLDLNTAAQAFYRRLDWRPTGRSKPGEWPPYPTISEWELPGG